MLEFKPLQSSSNIKKRNDEKFTTREVNANASNMLELRELAPTPLQKQHCRIQLGSVYYIGAFLVKKVFATQQIERTIACDKQWISIPHQQEIFKLFAQKHGLLNLSVSLLCPFDCELLRTPARGSLCDHIQCFSLENMLHLMQKVIPRKWRCPICKVLCFNILIDAYQLAIVNIIRCNSLQIDKVHFDLDGHLLHNDINVLERQWVPEQGQKNPNRIPQLEDLRRHLGVIVKNQDAFIRPGQ
jgi:hypothetical protein